MPADYQSVDRTFYSTGLLNPITRLVPSQLSLGGVESVQRPQECFKYAFRYLQEHADEARIRLLHGFARWSGQEAQPLPHAWVEVAGNIAFDPNIQEFYRAGEYRTARIYSVFREYSAEQAIDLEATNGGFGYPGEWDSVSTWFPHSCPKSGRTPGIYFLLGLRE